MTEEQFLQEVRLEAARRAWGNPRPMGPLTEAAQRVMDAVDESEEREERAKRPVVRTTPHLRIVH